MLRVLLVLLLLAGCAGQEGPGAKVVNEIHGEPIQGLRAAEPDLLGSGERLDLFLGIPVEVEALDQPRWKDVIYCVALNSEEDPLPEVADLVRKAPADKTIYVWGTMITKKHGFWWHGVDCRAHAIAVWHTKARDYIYFDLDYSLPLWRRFEIQSLLRRAVEAGGKAVVP